MKTTTVVTKGLAPGSLFKLIFVGLTFSLGFIIIFMGILVYLVFQLSPLMKKSKLESPDFSIHW
jgi:hypothetical protein